MLPMDLRDAFRGFARHPGFAAAAILSLAVTGLVDRILDVRQPSPAAVSKSMPSGNPTRLMSAFSMATYSANDPQWVNPGWVCASQTC